MSSGARVLGRATALTRSVLSGLQTKQQHTREADSSFDDLGWVKRRAQIAHGLRERETKSPQRPAHAQPLPHTQRVELVTVKIEIYSSGGDASIIL
eukprot:scaffold12509_cov63-Phaeocystis_antarctica.AAC.1